jgi:hypothetical protein
MREQESKKEEGEKQKAQYRRWALNDLMKRYPREKIYEEICAEPMIKVAKGYNVSDVALEKVCRKLNIPRPDRRRDCLVRRNLSRFRV